MIASIVKFILSAFYKKQRRLVMDQYSRSLSFGDYLVNRWDKSTFHGFGEGTSVYDNVLILGDVSIGKYTWIGPNCILDGSGGGLTIGDNCSIAAGVHIYTHDTVNKALSGGLAAVETQSVSIGNNCYIGTNSVIAKGSHIEDCCVIGALSFLNGIRIPSKSKVYGIPASIRGSID